MNIKNQELGLTNAAKRSLAHLEGVETLQDLVDNYSEQELFEDHRFQKHSVTYASIIGCLNAYGLQLYPTFYERKKGLGELPSVENPEEILLTELELSQGLIERMGHWEKLRTLGDLSRNLKEYGLKKRFRPEEFDLGEFSKGKVVLVDESEELKNLLRDKHSRDKVYFNGYPHFKLPKVVGHRDVQKMEQGWMGYGGGKMYAAKEPIYADAYYKFVELSWDEKKLLVRTLALYGLYPPHARIRPTLR